MITLTFNSHCSLEKRPGVPVNKLILRYSSINMKFFRQLTANRQKTVTIYPIAIIFILTGFTTF